MKRGSSSAYKETFTRENLIKLYNEYIANSGVTGLDGVRKQDFKNKLDEEIDIILRKVENQSYSFTRYRRRLISKGAGKAPRVISIPTLRDRLVLRALCNILHELYEDAKLDRPHQYIKSIRDELKEDASKTHYVRLDIKDFYPSVSHKLLLKTLRGRVRHKALLHLLEDAISTATDGVLTKPETGIPQGLSISNILSSIYLLNVDKKMDSLYSYYRYVDDIVVLCDEPSTKEINKEVRAAYRKRKLLAHDLTTTDKNKSFIGDIASGIEYLGFNFDGNTVSVRKSSFRKMIQNLLNEMTRFKRAKNKKESRFIWRMNLKISGCIYEGKRLGWVFFFSQINDKTQLSRLDAFLAKEFRKRQISHLYSRIKSFVKSYHEIRYNLNQTHYIPKFDSYSRADMEEEILVLEDIKEEELAAYDDKEIEYRFFKLISQQVADLERDLIDPFS